jgi:DNA-directed RNA polymerase beta' subunit
LVKPETITAINLEKMNRLLKNGTIKYVYQEISGKTNRVVVDDSNRTMKLQIGWKIERSMLDGDFVCMNRHPSLHRVSMMGHRAKITTTGLTIQLNPAVCPPYNADFDGDEMNLHLPTTLEAEAELQELFAVGKHLISPQNSRISLGAVQDCALGLYLLSDPVLVFDREDFFQLIYSADGNIPNIDNIACNGLGVVSSFIPSGFSFNNTNIVIQDSMLIKGRLSRGNIHAVITAVALDYTCEIAIELLAKWQLLACSYVTIRGFSISMNDCIMDSDSAEAVTSYIDETMKRIEKSTSSNAAKNSALGCLLGNLGSVASRHTDDTNSIVAMANSGAKGNSINLTQIRCAVGQQNVNGTRTVII